MRIAKADLVPTERTCARSTDVRAARGGVPGVVRAGQRPPHRETRRPPVEMLAEERARLHPLPAQPFTVAFGDHRRVNWDATVSVEGVRYSVPHPLVDTRVWVRFHGDDLVVDRRRPAPGRSRSPGTRAPHRAARRSRRALPAATPAAATAHGERTPRAHQRGRGGVPGARAGRRRLAGRGRRRGRARVRRKMAEAVALAKLHPPGQVDQALGTAAIAGPVRRERRAAHPRPPGRRDVAEPAQGRARPTACNPAPPPGPASASPLTTARQIRHDHATTTATTGRSRPRPATRCRGRRADPPAQAAPHPPARSSSWSRPRGRSAGTPPNRAGAARRGSRRPRRDQPAHPPQARAGFPAGKTLHDWDAPLVASRGPPRTR